MSAVERIAAPIPGFPGYYATKSGAVWSGIYKRRIYKRRGLIRLKPSRTQRGHLRVTMRRNGIPISAFVHRAVLLAFVGPCPEGQFTRHLDGDKTNNRLDNLRYGTQSENMQDGFRLGEYPIGEAMHCAKLTGIDVQWMRAYHRAGFPKQRLARVFGVAPRTAAVAIEGLTWRHIR